VGINREHRSHFTEPGSRQQERPMRITVLGATGGIGNALVHELAGRGHEVTAVSRSITAAHVPTGTRVRPADITDPVATRRVCAGAEAVVMAANLPYADWTRRLRPLVEGVLDAAVATDARFVMVDNLYGYGSPGRPITDASPEEGATRKARVRREIGDHLLTTHERGRGRVTIGRFSDYYGSYGDNSLVVMLGLRRVLAGRAPQAFIDADQPHTFAYLPDTARAFATLVEDPRADGRPWVLPAADAITQRALYRILCEVADAPVRLGRITKPMLWAAGAFDAQLREAREQIAQFDRPYTTRADDFEATFGHLVVTSHADALAASLEAHRTALATVA
jgi:nucleoside-diphosphate-sugar epimerase